MVDVKLPEGVKDPDSMARHLAKDRAEKGQKVDLMWVRETESVALRLPDGKVSVHCFDGTQLYRSVFHRQPPSTFGTFKVETEPKKLTDVSGPIYTVTV